ncbi:aminotransferase class V-fold PLP-dependent enzyme [Rhodococcus triatomae]|uniref:Probable hercynylcysteine sulfoxide lyase n=1 Tax=Rhodococcus triatomae TaxID=300028 RepID=A0A1G8A103_9NOCA|nr:aminotransferase class V-fold PLP-dependent enzyme [Rhodococcus triatomae]QNG17889.1 aminotransferase class V-fold PLP-dependent enzyme [Rhodococcus triatomae]QNG22443.1 aminotransferase class V-fold PLP-dependent enzyme [Rhodococcus triatomae]SDH14614.1 cysteine desulfurase [Rhodococcus triatomae]
MTAPGIDLERVRRDTPGCRERVFLDSAGSSLPPTPVLEAMVAHLHREARVGGYVAAAERADDLSGLKVSLARLVAADAASIALCDSATRAWNDFFQAVPLAAGDRVLVTEVEYAGNAIAVLQRARAVGASVDVVPSDDHGRIDLDALDRMLDERVRLVSLVHVPTNGGLVNPVREVADLAHEHGALVLLDACQSVGQLALDVVELHVDALSATGRKWLRGPRGTGFLYVRPDLQIEPAELDLHSAEWTAPDSYRIAGDASRFEFWEADVAARLGLGAAVDYLLELGVDEVERAVRAGADRVRADLSDIPGVSVRDLGEQRCGIVSFTVDGFDPTEVRDALAARDVVVTVSARTSTLLDMSARGLDAVVRASPHYFCSDEDLDVFVGAVREIAGR